MTIVHIKTITIAIYGNAPTDTGGYRFVCIGDIDYTKYRILTSLRSAARISECRRIHMTALRKACNRRSTRVINRFVTDREFAFDDVMTERDTAEGEQIIK